MHPRRDRRGRVARADHDLRHRPSDGFRTATAARFDALVAQAMAALPGDIAAYLRDVEVSVLPVPPPDALGVAEATGEMPMVQVTLPPTGPSTVEIYRRPLELRASSRSELQADLTAAIRGAVLDAIGGPPEDP